MPVFTFLDGATVFLADGAIEGEKDGFEGAIEGKMDGALAVARVWVALCIMNKVTIIKNMIEDIVEMTLMKVTKVTVDVHKLTYVSTSWSSHSSRNSQTINRKCVRT